MCWKCTEIEVILHYRTLIARMTDELTLFGLNLLIKKLEDEKKSLHPEQPGQEKARPGGAKAE